jgi:hypothetical protein
VIDKKTQLNSFLHFLFIKGRLTTKSIFRLDTLINNTSFKLEQSSNNRFKVRVKNYLLTGVYDSGEI